MRKPIDVDANIVRERLHRFAPYWERLVQVARGRGAGEYDAQDIASDAMLRVACAATLNEAADPWPYLASTVANLTIEYQRIAAKEHALSHRVSAVPVQRSPEHDVTDYAEAAWAIGQLAQTERSLDVMMMLRYAVGLSWSEVFTEFGVGRSRGQSRIWRMQRRARRWRRRH